ncbi:MAG: hypothetical protein VKJ44_08415, partial [Synechococcus sp.]|nr:hypothetical protein [Synechococcus sp.]
MACRAPATDLSPPRLRRIRRARHWPRPGAGPPLRLQTCPTRGGCASAPPEAMPASLTGGWIHS